MSDGPEAKPNGGGPQWSFVQWHKAGFQKLVTILPVDANLGDRPGPELKKTLGKAPGRLDASSGVWRFFKDWTTARHTLEDYARWDDAMVATYRAGIGLVLGNEIAIDIDVLEKVFALELRELAEQHFGKGAWRIGNAPKAAMLLRLKEGSMPFGKRTLSLAPPGWKPTKDGEESPHRIEILASGQQIVVEGIHATTRSPYMWLNGHPGAAGRGSLDETDLPAVDGFLYAAAKMALARGWQVGEVTGARHESGVDPKTPEELRCPDRYWPLMLACVAKLPNTTDRDGWIRMAYSLRGAAGLDRVYEGYEAYHAWSMKWRGGNSDAAIDKAWGGVKPTHLGWESLAVDLNAAGIPDVERARRLDEFEADGKARGAEAEKARAEAQAQAAVDESGVEPSPYWTTLEGAFKGTRDRIQRALSQADAASPSVPDEAYLRVRLAMTWYGRVAWLGTGWVEYLAIPQSFGTKDTWPGIWSPVDEGQLELRIDGFIRMWLARYASEKTIVKQMGQMLSKSTLRAPRMRALMLLGPDCALGDTVDPTSLMEEASSGLIALPGGRCIEWANGDERNITRADCVLAALKLDPAPLMDWSKAPYLWALLQGLLGGWEDRTMPQPPHWTWFQAWLGYSLAGCRPAMSLQHALVLRGAGGEGKGTLFRLLREALGAYCGEISITQLVKGKTTHANDEIAPILRGKRMLLVAEASGEGMVWQDELVKSLIGNEAIRGRLMHKDGVRVHSRVAMMMAGNVMPKWETVDQSVIRRFWWLRTPGGATPDPEFWGKVSQEKAMLLRWMLDGIALWRGKSLESAELRGAHIFEDTEGRAGDGSAGMYKGAVTTKTAYGSALTQLTTVIAPGMRDAAEIAQAEIDVTWLDCIPVTHLPWATAAWAHTMRERGQLGFGLMEWERVRSVAVAALRDFAATPDGKVYRMSKRFGREQRRYLLATWTDKATVAEMVDKHLRYMLGLPPIEWTRLGKVPPDLPGVVKDIERSLAARGLLGDEEGG